MNSSINGDRPGKLPKPPLKATKGYKQLGVADFFKPSNQTAREKKTAEREAAKAHAERVAGDRAAEAERDAATAEKKRMPGRPPKLASGISSRGAGPLLGRKDTKRKGAFNPFTCARTRTHAPTHTYVHAHTYVHTYPHTRTRTRTYTYIRTSTQRTHAHTYMHNCIHTYTRTHVHNARTYTRTHTHAHAHMSTHAHVRARTRACIHVLMQLRGPKALA